jgi:site-specific DNA recombinase
MYLLGEDALHRYADHTNGKIVKFFRIAETASKSEERKTFRELIVYAKQHALDLDGVLFYKVDRAARNLFDYVELERLESEYNVPFISVSQQTDNNPAGRMMRRTLANMASFYTEQQSVDVREGLARRVQEGWFVGLAPYGYKNVRVDGRSIVQIDTVPGDNVRRMFHLYAYESLTLDRLIDKLHAETRIYRAKYPKFVRSKVHEILQDRACIGEIEHQGIWYPGKHDPLVDRGTWDRVKTLLGGHQYHAHALTFAGEWLTCGYCGRPITGENKTKKTKSGSRSYVYYRCAAYNSPGHPRIRVTEASLDQQVLGWFEKMKVMDPAIKEWFAAVLKAQTLDQQLDRRAQEAELMRQITMYTNQQDRLLNLRLSEEIDEQTFGRKHQELRDRLAQLTLQQEALHRGSDELAELVTKVFELSQTLHDKWVTADYATKRRILEIVCLNCRLVDASLFPTHYCPAISRTGSTG